MSGDAFAAALAAYLAGPGEQAYTALLVTATAHANQTGHVEPIPVPGELGRFTPAPLVTEYERLRDDPSAAPRDVRAAAEALTLARMAHRVRAGRPIASGAP